MPGCLTQAPVLLGLPRSGPGQGLAGGGVLARRTEGAVGSPQVIQQPPKPGALIRPPQVALTQTPMVALRQPHSRIVLTAPPQVQLSQLQPGECLSRLSRAGVTWWPVGGPSALTSSTGTKA